MIPLDILYIIAFNINDATTFMNFVLMNKSVYSKCIHIYKLSFTDKYIMYKLRINIFNKVIKIDKVKDQFQDIEYHNDKIINVLYKMLLNENPKTLIKLLLHMIEYFNDDFEWFYICMMYHDFVSMIYGRLRIIWYSCTDNDEAKRLEIHFKKLFKKDISHCIINS